MNKTEILAFIKANTACHVATVENGAPRVRGLRVWKVDEKDGIMFQTWKGKDVSKQLSKNPQVELCFNNYEANIQVRVRGKMELVEDAAAKKQVLADKPFLKPFVEQGQELALYRLKNGLAHVWTMAVNFAPKEFIKL